MRCFRDTLVVSRLQQSISIERDIMKTLKQTICSALICIVMGSVAWSQNTPMYPYDPNKASESLKVSLATIQTQAKNGQSVLSDLQKNYDGSTAMLLKMIWVDGLVTLENLKVLNRSFGLSEILQDSMTKGRHRLEASVASMGDKVVATEESVKANVSDVLSQESELEDASDPDHRQRLELDIQEGKLYLERLLMRSKKQQSIQSAYQKGLSIYDARLANLQRVEQKMQWMQKNAQLHIMDLQDALTQADQGRVPSDLGDQAKELAIAIAIMTDIEWKDPIGWTVDPNEKPGGIPEIDIASQNDQPVRISQEVEDLLSKAREAKQQEMSVEGRVD